MHYSCQPITLMHYSVEPITDTLLFSTHYFNILLSIHCFGVLLLIQYFDALLKSTFPVMHYIILYQAITRGSQAQNSEHSLWGSPRTAWSIRCWL